MKQLGNTKVLIILLVVLAVALGGYWWSQQSATPPAQYTAPKTSELDIQNPNDLMMASDDLDKSDIDSAIDSQLSQNDTDATSF